MHTTKIAGAAAALALMAAPATAAAHDGHHHGRHHHNHRANVREVTGAATATVASFTDGDLTLTLPSGRTFDATVSAKTIVDCVTAAPQAQTARHGDGNDNDGPNHDAGDDNGAGNGSCDPTTALVAGAKVAYAKLALIGGDATWKKVVVVR